MRAYDIAETYRWVPAQVSTSSLDRGSKLRGVVGCTKSSSWRLEIDSRKRSYHVRRVFFTENKFLIQLVKTKLVSLTNFDRTPKVAGSIPG